MAIGHRSAIAEASWVAPSALSDSLSSGRWIDQQFYRHASELLGVPWAAEPKLLPRPSPAGSHARETLPDVERCTQKS